MKTYPFLTRRMRARAPQVLKFVGCYHGHADSFLVQAGSGVATLGLPDSPGVPASSTGARPRLRRPPASPASARQAPGILPSLVVTRAGGLHSLVVTRARTRVEQGKPQVTRTSSQRECRAGALLPPRLGCTVRAGCGWAPRACEDGGRRRCAASERASCTITAQSSADAASPGVRAATTLTATYNDLEGVRKVFEANKGEIAGVILEPVVGNSGFIAPTQEFLQARALASRAPAHAPAHARLASCRARGWRACLRRAHPPRLLHRGAPGAGRAAVPGARRSPQRPTQPTTPGSGAAEPRAPRAGPARRVHGGRRAAVLRRGHDRLPHRQGLRAGALWHHARPHHRARPPPSDRPARTARLRRPQARHGALAAQLGQALGASKPCNTERCCQSSSSGPLARCARCAREKPARSAALHAEAAGRGAAHGRSRALAA